MRRAGYAGIEQDTNKPFIEEQNEQLTKELSDKISTMKKISIEIGDEIRGQNNLLKDMDSDFDKTGGFLHGAIGRLTSLSKAGHGRIWCYMLLFVLFVFFVIYLVLKSK